MANPEHVKIVRQGAETIRKWRVEHSDESLDLSSADRQEVDLSQADLRGVNLRMANLKGACVSGAYLDSANLQGAYLPGLSGSSEHVNWKRSG
jgi:uncharacterized protein YjbI with pentapeptide repeats